jgi:hypothetical protein
MLDNLGSDHLPILFTIRGSEEVISSESNQTNYNCKLADWKLFEGYLSELASKSRIFSQEPPDFTRNLLKLSESSENYLEEISSELVRLIQLVVTKAIPKIKSKLRAKPWWTPEIKILRKLIARAQRNLRFELNQEFYQD